jgi:hypothetical protein
VPFPVLFPFPVPARGGPLWTDRNDLGGFVVGISIGYIIGGVKSYRVSSELVKAMVRKGRRAIDGYRINGRLSFMLYLHSMTGCDLRL